MAKTKDVKLTSKEISQLSSIIDGTLMSIDDVYDSISWIKLLEKFDPKLAKEWREQYEKENEGSIPL